MCPLPSQFKINPNTGAVASGEVGRSKYDAGYSPVLLNSKLDLDEYRAQQQGRFDKLGRGVGRAVGRALTSVGEGAAAVGGLASWTVQSRESSTFDKFVNNAFTQAFQDADEGIKDFFAVYTPEAVATGNLWDNLSSASFWANEAADGVGFMLGMMAPGTAIGRVGIGAKLARGTNKVFGYAKVGKAFANNVDLAVTTAYQTASEAAFEAGAVTSSMRQKRTQALEKIAAGQSLTEEEQRFANMTDEEIGNSGFRTFMGNALILTGPNLLMNKWLFGRFGNKTKASVFATELENSAKGIKPPVQTKMQKFTAGLGNVAKGAASEGAFEEGFQMAIEEAEMSGENSWNPESLLGTYISNLSDVNVQKGMFIGALLGGPMSAYGAYQQKKADTATRQEVINNITATAGLYSNAMSGSDTNPDGSINEAKVAVRAAALKLQKGMSERGIISSPEASEELMDVGVIQMMAAQYGKLEGGMDLFIEKMNEAIESESSSFAGKLGMAPTATKAEQKIRVAQIAKNIERAIDVAGLYSGAAGFYSAKDKVSRQMFDEQHVSQLEQQIALYDNVKSVLSGYMAEKMRLEAEQNPANAPLIEKLDTLIGDFQQNLSVLEENIQQGVDSKTVQAKYDEFYEKYYSKQKEIIDKGTKEYETAKKNFKEGDSIEWTFADGTKKTGTLTKQGKDWVVNLGDAEVNIGSIYSGKAAGEITNVRVFKPAQAQPTTATISPEVATSQPAPAAEPPAPQDSNLTPSDSATTGSVYDQFAEDTTSQESVIQTNTASAEEIQHEEDGRTKKNTIMATAGLDVEYTTKTVQTKKGPVTFYYTKYDENGKPIFNSKDNQDVFFDWARIVSSGSINEPNFEFRPYIYEMKGKDAVADELYSNPTAFDVVDGRSKVDGSITAPGEVTIKLVAFKNGEPVRHNGKLVYTTMHSDAFRRKTQSGEAEENAFTSWRADLIKALLAGEEVRLKPTGKSAGHPIYEPMVLDAVTGKRTRVRMPLEGRVYPKGQQKKLKLYVGKKQTALDDTTITINGKVVPVAVNGAVYTTKVGANGKEVPIRLITARLTEDQAKTVAGLIELAYRNNDGTPKKYANGVQILTDGSKIGILPSIVSMGVGKDVHVSDGVLTLSTGYSTPISNVTTDNTELLSELQKLYFNVSEKLIDSKVNMPVFGTGFNTKPTAEQGTPEYKKQLAAARKLKTVEVDYNKYLDDIGVLKTDLVPDSQPQFAQIYWTFDTRLLNVAAPIRVEKAPAAVQPVVTKQAEEEAFFDDDDIDPLLALEAANAQDTEKKAVVEEKPTTSSLAEQRAAELLAAEEAWRSNVDESGFPKESLQPIQEEINKNFDALEAAQQPQDDDAILLSQITSDMIDDDAFIDDEGSSFIDEAPEVDKPLPEQTYSPIGFVIDPITAMSDAAVEDVEISIQEEKKKLPAEKASAPIAPKFRNRKTELARLKEELGRLGVTPEMIAEYEKENGPLKGTEQVESTAALIMSKKC